ncbi:MAG: SAM-dependent methyltransferase [Verrucomicrobia bacterium]|nr:SAM-dependent methyltransferase [Verrucomicrobiota bacterium]
MNALAEIIRRAVARHGAIPFAQFMELALYHPAHGYYERAPGVTGRRGDFYTSVSVGSLFGELLAFQFARWFEELRTQNSELKTPQVVEAGAHDGRLASDILRHLQQHEPELSARLEYCILEPSLRRQAWQRETLNEFSPRVRWHDALPTVRPRPQTPDPIPDFTVLFFNELLDAFPVRRLGWDARAGRWFEWGVACRDENFIWTRLPLAENEAAHLLASTFNLQPSTLSSVLPDGFTVEISPAATAWWADAAASLRHGKLLTLDYGLAAEQFLAPERAHGTLRAYHQHHVSGDVLACPGEQDLTAHVNFTALQRAGETAGLATETFCSQAQFLTRIAEKTWQAGARFGEWTPARTRQFQTLTHPEHLGRPFQVLLQTSA